MIDEIWNILTVTYSRRFYKSFLIILQNLLLTFIIDIILYMYKISSMIHNLYLTYTIILIIQIIQTLHLAESSNIDIYIPYLQIDLI